MSESIIVAQDTTAVQLAELAYYEGIIERGLETFIEIGNAFLTIRDRRLYQQSYSTFENYCRERWGYEKSHTYRLMDAARVVENLETSPMGEVLPTSERQARPLTSLSPDEQREVWALVVESAPRDNGGSPKITAAMVQQAVDGHKGKPLSVHFSRGSGDWLTPPEIIERVVQTLGEIDLDPCSNSGEPNIPANHHLTPNDNGLAHPWYGRVYMNPPYGDKIADWVTYLREQYESGNTSEAIALVPARTDTKWFRELREYPRCFIWGRLKFSGHDNSAPFPSMAVYLGDNLAEFVAAFSDIGDVYSLVLE